MYPKSQYQAARRTSSNPQPTEVPAPQKQYFGNLGVRHVVCIIGLPNRGKTYVAQELAWYLEFFHGAEVKHFYVSDISASSTQNREENAQGMLCELQTFLEGSEPTTPTHLVNLSREDKEHQQKMKATDSGKVAIITPHREKGSLDCDPEHFRQRISLQDMWACTNAVDREWVRENIARIDKSCKLMFIEIEVNDEKLLKQHMQALPEDAHTWFPAFEAAYARAYTPLGCSAHPEDELSYLKLINFRDMHTHNMYGYLRMRIAQFLSVLRPCKHTIYLSRHGESTYNVQKKLGGNPGLSPLGEEYAKRLGEYAPRCIQHNPHTKEVVPSRLWTSSLIRTDETAAHIPKDPVTISAGDGSNSYEWQQMSQRVYRQLDEIFAGMYDGLTEAQIKEKDEQFSVDRGLDKLGMRYPKGESYLDLITRLEPLIHELLSYEEPLLIVSHQAVLRVLRAYLLRRPRENCPAERIPQHTVMKITWDGWHFPANAAPQEEQMKKKNWPPPETERWTPSTEPVEEIVGREEWIWLGPNTECSDGQKNM